MELATWHRLPVDGRSTFAGGEQHKTLSSAALVLLLLLYRPGGARRPRSRTSRPRASPPCQAETRDTEDDLAAAIESTSSYIANARQKRPHLEPLRRPNTRISRTVEPETKPARGLA